MVIQSILLHWNKERNIWKKKQNKHYNHHILNGYHTQMDTLES